MYEFGLNNVKIQEIRAVGKSGTASVLHRYQYHSCSGEWYRYHFGWYRYHLVSASVVPVPPCSGTGTSHENCPEMADFPYFTHLYSILFLYSILLQKPIMNYSQNNSNMDHNPYINRTRRLVRVCSKLKLHYLQLNHESNLKGRIPYPFCTI